MSAMSNYLEVEIVKHIFRTGSFTKPAVLGIALFTSAPSDAGGGTEVSGNGYTRVAQNPLDANWAATDGTNGTTSNSTAITFPTPTGAGWGTVTHFAIFDATTAGNLLIHGALTASKTINAGDTVSFAPNQLQVIFA